MIKKQSCYIIIFRLVLFTVLSSITNAQWQPEVRLTNDPAESYLSGSNTWNIAVSGNTLFIVWSDLRDGNQEVYFKRSIDNGLSWGNDVRLTNNPFRSWYPSLAVSNQFVHIVWEDSRDGNQEIYYKRSTDSGITWGPDIRVTNSPVYSFTPSIAVSGQDVHIVWHNNRVGNNEIYYKRSTDGGVSWDAETRLTNNSSGSMNASISVLAQMVQVVWEDNRDGNYEIYNKRSTDRGTNWSSDSRLTNNASGSFEPSIGMSVQTIQVVWKDHRDGNTAIYTKYSVDGGISWSNDMRLTDNSAISENPTIAVSGQFVHVVWMDRRFGNTEIFYIRSTDKGINWGSEERLTNNSGYSDFPSIAISEQVVHVVWSDYRHGNYEIYYIQNPLGNSIGIESISSEIPKRFTLHHNYPNPFNPNTKIKFALPKSSDIEFSVHDILGRKVYSAYYNKPAGVYEIDFDGSGFASGIYFYSVKAGDYSETRKMIILK